MMGAVAIHVPTREHPLPTIKYFGLENLQQSEPSLKLEGSATVEGCRQAAFGNYRSKGYNTSALLMIAAWVYAKGRFKAAHMLATQQEWLRDYTRRKIGIPLISPRLPLIGRPKTNAEGVFWETKPVPLIIPLEPALFAQCWRLLEEKGMNGRLIFEDCPCPDPLLRSYFPTS